MVGLWKILLKHIDDLGTPILGHLNMEVSYGFLT